MSNQVQANSATAATNPQTVLVDIQSPATMNPQRRKRPYLMPEFEGLNSEGKPWRYRFVDVNGKGFSPRLPLSIDISTEYGKKLLLTVQAYQMFIEPAIQIFNPITAAIDELDKADKILEAMNRLKELRAEKDDETLVNLLRRIEGPVGNRTIEMVITALVRIAQNTPQAILTLDADPRFKQKVLIDKALESGRLLLRSGYYQYPPEVFEGRMIAEGEVKMLSAMDHDADLLAYIQQSASVVGQSSRSVFNPQNQTVTPAISEEQRAALKLLEGVGKPITDSQSQEGGSIEDLEDMNEAQIRALVQQAIASNYLDDIGGKIKVEDGSLRTPADAEVYYLSNSRAAEAMRREMEQIGIFLS